jgi:hypothetical protein
MVYQPYQPYGQGGDDRSRRASRQARARQLQRERAKRAQDNLAFIMQAQAPDPANDYRARLETKPGTTKLLTAQEANQKANEKYFSHISPPKANDDPTKESAKDELIKVAEPGLFSRIIEGYNASIARPLQAPVYYGLLKLERMRKNVIGDELTPEEEAQFSTAENALNEYFSKNKYIGISFDKSNREESQRLLETAWNSNPLPRFLLGSMEMIVDPLNFVPIGLATKIGVRSARLAVSKGKIPGGALARQIQRMMPQNSVIDDVADVNPGVVDEAANPRGAGIGDDIFDDPNTVLGRDLDDVMSPDTPYTNRQKMVEIGANWAREKFLSIKNRAMGFWNPSKAMHKADWGARISFWFSKVMSNSEGAIAQVGETARYKFEEGFSILKDTGQNSGGIITNIQVADAPVWEQYIGKRTTSALKPIKNKKTGEITGFRKQYSKKPEDQGVLDKRVSELKLEKKRLSTRLTQTKDKIAKSDLEEQLVKVDARLEGTSKDLLELRKKYEVMEYIRLRPQMVESLSDELRGLLDHNINNIMEYQNFYKFSPNQMPFVNYYNETYLPLMQRLYREIGTVDDFINEDIGRKYFPRIGRGYVYEDVGGKSELVFRGNAWIDRPRALNTATMGRVLQGPLDEGLHSVDYFGDPIAVMMQAYRGLASAVAHAGVETRMVKVINKVYDTAKSIAASDKATSRVLIRGPLAQALTQGEKKVMTASDVLDRFGTFTGTKDPATGRPVYDKNFIENMKKHTREAKIVSFSELGQELDRLTAEYMTNISAQNTLGKVVATLTGDTTLVGANFADFAKGKPLVIGKEFHDEIVRLSEEMPGEGFDEIAKLIKNGQIDPTQYVPAAGYHPLDVIAGVSFDPSLADETSLIVKQLQDTVAHIQNKQAEVIPNIASLRRAMTKDITQDIAGEAALKDGFRVGRVVKEFMDKTMLKPHELSHLKSYKLATTPTGIAIGPIPTFKTQLQEAVMKPIRITQDVAQFLRFLGTGYDAGWGFVQGLYLLTSGSAGAKTWVQIWKQTADAMSNPNWKPFHQQIMSQEQELVNFGRQQGLVVEVVAEQTDALIKSNSWVGKAATGVQRVAALPSKVTVKGRALSLQNMPAMFQSASNYARIMMFKSKLPGAHRHALKKAQLTDDQLALARKTGDQWLIQRYDDAFDVATKDVAEHVNKATGVLQISNYGLSTSQRAIEASLFFAPRFVRSQIALMADIASGSYKGELAREAVMKLGASGMIFYTAICLASGQDPKLNPLPKSQGGDGGEFMTWAVPGTTLRMGIGGTMMTTLKFGARLIAAGKDGDALDDEFDKDWDENMFSKYFINKMSPVIGLGQTVLRGQTYGGHKLEWGGETIADTIGKSAYTAGSLVSSHLAPFWAASVFDGPGNAWGSKAVGGPSEFLGLQTWHESPWSTVTYLKNQYAKDDYGVVSWSELDRDQRRETIEKHEDLDSAIQIAEEADWFTPRQNEVQEDITSYYEEAEDAVSRLVEELDTVLGQFDNRRPGDLGRKLIQEANRKYYAVMDTISSDHDKAMEYFNRPRPADERIPYLEAARLDWVRSIKLNPDLYDEQTLSYNYELRQEIEDNLREVYGNEMFNYIERSWLETHSEDHPLAVEYYLINRMLRGYYSIPELVLDQVGASYGITYDGYKDWQTAVRTDEFRTSNYSADNLANLKYVDNIIVRTKRSYREQHQDADHMLYRWGHSDTLYNADNLAFGVGATEPERKESAKAFLGKRRSGNMEEYFNTRKLDNNETIQ